jgi:hypothetical protein
LDAAKIDRTQLRKGGLTEFERDFIRARTGEGRARAKATQPIISFFMPAFSCSIGGVPLPAARLHSFGRGWANSTPS